MLNPTNWLIKIILIKLNWTEFTDCINMANFLVYQQYKISQNTIQYFQTQNILRPQPTY
jgi:hypothetical protein